MCIWVVRIDAGTSFLLQLLSTLADILNLHMPQFLHMQKGSDKVYAVLKIKFGHFCLSMAIVPDRKYLKEDVFCLRISGSVHDSGRHGRFSPGSGNV